MKEEANKHSNKSNGHVDEDNGSDENVTAGRCHNFLHLKMFDILFSAVLSQGERRRLQGLMVTAGATRSHRGRVWQQGHGGEG